MGATLTNWSARPPRWVRLFKSMLGACAVMAVASSFWLLAGDSQVARGLVASVVVLTTVRLFILHKDQGADNSKNINSISRIATSHWRITSADRICDGWLQHVWYGWGWVTLRIQPYAQTHPITLTVWRVSVSGAAWHQLRVWTAWDLAMASSPTLTEVRQ